MQFPQTFELYILIAGYIPVVSFGKKSDNVSMATPRLGYDKSFNILLYYSQLSEVYQC